MKKLPAPRGARDSLSAICVPPAHSGRSFSAHRGQAADFWRRGLWVCEVHLLCPPLRPAGGLSRPPNQHSTTCHACQQSSARLCRTMVMVQRVQPRPFRVWSKCGAQRQKPLLQYTATCRSGRATQHLLGSTTDLRCPAGYSSCPSRRGWGVRCPFCWPYIYLGVNCWSPDAWCVTFAFWRQGGHCVQHAPWLAPRTARNAQRSPLF